VRKEQDDRDPQTYAILGACFTVHGFKGCGFNEPVYHECLEIEFEFCNIPYVHEKEYLLDYRDRQLNSRYYADFVCYDAVIVECKAVEKLTDKHRAQLLNYLKASGLRKGLLVNFGNTSLEYERFVL
jgi:GxxExxY protein